MMMLIKKLFGQKSQTSDDVVGVHLSAGHRSLSSETCDISVNMTPAPSTPKNRLKRRGSSPSRASWRWESAVTSVTKSPSFSPQASSTDTATFDDVTIRLASSYCQARSPRPVTVALPSPGIDVQSYRIGVTANGQKTPVREKVTGESLPSEDVMNNGTDDEEEEQPTELNSSLYDEWCRSLSRLSTGDVLAVHKAAERSQDDDVTDPLTQTSSRQTDDTSSEPSYRESPSLSAGALGRHSSRIYERKGGPVEVPSRYQLSSPSINRSIISNPTIHTSEQPVPPPRRNRKRSDVSQSRLSVDVTSQIVPSFLTNQSRRLSASLCEVSHSSLEEASPTDDLAQSSDSTGIYSDSSLLSVSPSTCTTDPRNNSPGSYTSSDTNCPSPDTSVIVVDTPSSVLQQDDVNHVEDKVEIALCTNSKRSPIDFSSNFLKDRSRRSRPTTISEVKCASDEKVTNPPNGYVSPFLARNGQRSPWNRYGRSFVFSGTTSSSTSTDSNHPDDQSPVSEVPDEKLSNDVAGPDEQSSLTRTEQHNDSVSEESLDVKELFELRVLHSLHGNLHQSVVQMTENCTCEEIIQDVLLQENIDEDCHLFQITASFRDTEDGDLKDLQTNDQPVITYKEYIKEEQAQFELKRRKDVHIKVVTDIGHARTKKIDLDLRPNTTVAGVIETAIDRFDLQTKQPSGYSLILIDKSTKKKKVPTATLR